jgi:aryl sulfotransferase
VLSWVDAAELNRLAIRYEDMLTHPEETFSRAAAFLALPHEPERIGKAIRFSDFREVARQEAEKGFRERPHHTERFFREGRSGDWREKLTPEQVNRIVADHSTVMRRFGYLDERGCPV